jgi:hypothetical protein
VVSSEQDRGLLPEDYCLNAVMTVRVSRAILRSSRAVITKVWTAAAGLQPEQEPGVDGAGAGGDHQTFQWGEPHRGVDAAAVDDGGQ